MAVYHCHTHPISRSGTSGSALACAAYRSGEALQEQGEKRALSAAELAAYRTGEAVADGSGRVHDYTRKGGVAHTEIVLPEGVDAEWARDRAALWNQAEAAEKRVNSRVAREWRVALPHELRHDERVALAHDFAERLVERYGVAADVAVHAPSRSGDQRNWHAHVLCTTRVIANEGFGAKAEIEWSNANLKKAGLPYTSVQVREMRMLWEERANEHLARTGHENRIDARSYAEQGVALEAARTVHVGQVYAEERDRVEGTERILPVERLDAEQSARNAEAIEADPSLLLDRITRSEAVFTRHDVARSLHRFVNEDMGRFERTLNEVMRSDELVCLVEGGRTADTGREVEPIWTTRAVATREAAMLDRADRLVANGEGRLAVRSIERGIAAVENRSGDHSSSSSNGERFSLSNEQREAVRTLAGDGQLAVLRGVAGTGKTTALSAFREAAEIEDRRVVGGALAGKAARELEEGSGIEARTLASWERSWEAGFDRLGRGDVFVMDEAGMVGSAQMARVMERVEAAGAKLVLVGDERQLQPIEAGAAFRNVKERVESLDRVAGQGVEANAARTVAELTGVRRQSEGWQREASAAFGQGEAGAALDAYRERGEVRLHDSTEQTHAAIVAEYFRHRDAATGTERPAEGAGQDARNSSESGGEATRNVEAAREARMERRSLLGALRSAIGLERGTKDAREAASETPTSSELDGAREIGAERREPDHIVTAYRNADVDALNAAIRAERVNRGELGEGAHYRTDRGRAEFARGDHVLLTANDRQLGVANGDRGIVTEAGADRLSLRTRDGRDVTIDAERYQGVRHGYAVTTHRAQGMSVDRVHVMAGRGMDAPLTYVAMTRQREGATLHASRDHFRDYATLRDAVSRDRRAHGVGDYLPRPGNALGAVAERVRETQRIRAAERVAARTVGQDVERGTDHDGTALRDRLRDHAVRESMEPAPERGPDAAVADRGDLRQRLRNHAAGRDSADRDGSGAGMDGSGAARADDLRARLAAHAAGQARETGVDGRARSGGRDMGSDAGKADGGAHRTGAENDDKGNDGAER